MNIRLYHSNDSRPTGDYENVRTATIVGNRLFFISNRGNRYFTTLNFKLTLTPDDLVKEREDGSVLIEGHYDSNTKKKGKKNVNSAKQSSLEQESSLFQPVPRASENPGADSDEVLRLRSRRSSASTGNRGHESNSISYEAAGPDEDF